MSAKRAHQSSTQRNGKRANRVVVRAPAERAKRVRFAGLPKPDEATEVTWARGRQELNGMTCGEMLEVAIGTQAFREVIVPICEKLDAKRSKRGPAPRYTALELETVLLYGHVCGELSVKETRDRLSSDRGRDARRVIGLNRPRETMNRVRTLTDGIPSEATLCRHRRRFGLKRRKGAYMRLFREMVQEHLREFPELREEARLMQVDGTAVQTHFECLVPHHAKDRKGDPIRDENGDPIVVVKNFDKITCWDGGFNPKHADDGKNCGHGYNAVIATTFSHLPMALEVTALNESEKVTGRAIAQEIGRSVTPHLDPEKLRVAVFDGGFHSPKLRHEWRESGYVEQVHKASHADAERSKANAAQLGRMRLPIEGYPNWTANGHFELECKCGSGHVWKELKMRRGCPVVRHSGDCPKCGRISITSGQWRQVKNYGTVGQSAWVRCNPGEEADLGFGNPLTYHDQLAKVYGKKRHAHGEGFNGALRNRFRINKDLRWVRHKDRVTTELAAVFSVIHAISMEQRRRAAARSSAGSDPLLALAA